MTQIIVQGVEPWQNHLGKEGALLNRRIAKAKGATKHKWFAKKGYIHKVNGKNCQKWTTGCRRGCGYRTKCDHYTKKEHDDFLRRVYPASREPFGCMGKKGYFFNGCPTNWSSDVHAAAELLKEMPDATIRIEAGRVQASAYGKHVVVDAKPGVGPATAEAIARLWLRTIKARGNLGHCGQGPCATARCLCGCAACNSKGRA